MKWDTTSFGLGCALGAFLGMILCGVVGAVVLIGWQLGRTCAADEQAPWYDSACPTSGDEGLTGLLTPIRNEHRVPAIAGAIVTSEGMQAVGAVGIRKHGADVAVTLEDRWHLGSDTKAMTATLVARLVEQGRLHWDATMEEAFPSMAEDFHSDAKAITVRHLLSHRAGLAANLDLGRFGGDDIVRLRHRAVRQHLAKPPRHPPGTVCEYSNLGYIIAGAVVEQVTDKPWEEEIEEQVFQPLGMDTAGFGGLGTEGKIDQPWPHRSDGSPMPMNGPAIDNPPVMGPAGRVHCTMQDWALFIQDQLRGTRGESALLSSESYVTLHTPPPGGDYALGWGVTERDWGGGKVLHHAGDNTMNHANVWVAPRRDFAILVCVNQGGDQAARAADEAVGALIGLHNKEREQHSDD